MKLYISLLLLFIFSLNACEDPVYTPKPRGFPKVELPEKEYQKFSESYCDFTFNYPTYAKVEQDRYYFENEAPHPCWFDINVPQLAAKIHCSYVSLEKEIKTLDDLRNDAFKLVSKHNVKADYIDELPIKRPDGTFGYAFDIEGPVASPFQFFLTDGEKHFLRGSLYFNAEAKPDSLAPMYDFMKTDIMELINTIEWSN